MKSSLGDVETYLVDRHSRVGSRLKSLAKNPLKNCGLPKPFPLDFVHKNVHKLII